MATPSPSIIESNIRNWVKKWLEIGGDLITESVLSEIENLLVHVRHGCLSGIPRGCGTNRNENLHMLLNRHFNRSRIGVLLAYALLSVTIYTYNNKIHFKGKTVTPPVTSLAVETDSDTDEHFGIVPKTTGIYPTLNELMMNMHSGTSTDQDEYDRDNAAAILQQALCYAASYTQFQDTQDTKQTKIIDWVKSDKIRPVYRADIVISGNQTHEDTLTSNLSSLGFAASSVPGDGNCFFHSVNKAIDEAVKCHPNFNALLSSVGYDITASPDNKVGILRHLLVEEWLGERRSFYEDYIESTQNYTLEARKFEHNEHYDSDFGDLMAQAMANALSVTLCVLTSFRHETVMVFLPQKCSEVIPDAINLYIAYNGAGAGHYDGVTKIVPQKESPASFCRCGVNKKEDNVISCTAINKSTKYKCRCPCLRDGNSCKAICKCKGCKNPNGARMVLSPTASRKRNYSKLQCVDIPSSKRFALDRQEQLQTGKWTVLETFALDRY